MMTGIPGGLRTWAFDGEGVPHQKTPVIEKGDCANSYMIATPHKKMEKKALGRIQSRIPVDTQY